MSELTVFVNVFFRNENEVADFYESVQHKIGPHRAVFLVNNVSPAFAVDRISVLGEVVRVDEILLDHALTGVDALLQSKNSKYVRHFFAGVSYCKTDYFSFFDPDNECADYGWISEAQETLGANVQTAAACPNWRPASTSQTVHFDSGFSDQLFVGKAVMFKRFDYSIDSLYSWMFPLRDNGATFESAVFSNFLKHGLKRAVLCRYSYSHANEGNSYAAFRPVVGLKRLLARTGWTVRSHLVKD